MKSLILMLCIFPVTGYTQAGQYTWTPPVSCCGQEKEECDRIYRGEVQLREEQGRELQRDYEWIENDKKEMLHKMDPPNRGTSRGTSYYSRYSGSGQAQYLPAPRVSFSRMFRLSKERPERITRYLSHHGWRMNHSLVDPVNPALHTERYEYRPYFDILGGRRLTCLISIVYEDRVGVNGRQERVLKSLGYAGPDSENYLRAANYLQRKNFKEDMGRDIMGGPEKLYEKDGRSVVSIPPASDDSFFSLTFFPSLAGK